MAQLKDQYTHISDLKGKIRTGSTQPTNTGPAGLAAGEMYLNTNNNAVNLYSGSAWTGKVLTTTSTSTSTSTSTTTTSTSTTTTG